MAVDIIVYPAANANSFVSITDADVVINNELDHASWTSLDKDTKARWLIFSYQRFILLKDFVPPADLTDSCLPKANAIASLHAIRYELNELQGEQQVRVDKVGPLYNEYFKNEQLDRLSITDYPRSVVQCLETYGVVSPNSVDGIGSFRRTR